MLIINIEGNRKVLWTFVEAGECPRCHSRVQHKTVHTWRRLLLWFVLPMCSYANRWFVECPVCEHRRPISSERANSPTMTMNECFAK